MVKINSSPQELINSFIIVCIHQGLTNLEAFQEQVKTVQLFQQQKTEFTDDASQYFNSTNLLDLGDGTQV